MMINFNKLTKLFAVVFIFSIWIGESEAVVITNSNKVVYKPIVYEVKVIYSIPIISEVSWDLSSASVDSYAPWHGLTACLSGCDQDNNLENFITQTGREFSVHLYADILSADVDSTDYFLGFGFNVFHSDNLNLVDSFSIYPVNIVSDAWGLAVAGLFEEKSSLDELDIFESFHYKLLNLVFIAESEGPANIHIVADINDPNQGLIFLNREPIGFNIEKTFTVVPLPPAVFLFLNGLLLLAIGKVGILRSQANSGS